MFKPFSIVKVARLAKEWDLDEVPTPDDMEDDQRDEFIKNHKLYCKEHKDLLGKNFIVKEAFEENDIRFYELITEEGNPLEKKYADTPMSIVFSEDELDLLYEDYFNNCCREKLQSPSQVPNYTCDTCAFTFNQILGTV